MYVPLRQPASQGHEPKRRQWPRAGRLTIANACVAVLLSSVVGGFALLSSGHVSTAFGAPPPSTDQEADVPCAWDPVIGRGLVSPPAISTAVASGTLPDVDAIVRDALKAASAAGAAGIAGAAGATGASSDTSVSSSSAQSGTSSVVSGTLSGTLRSDGQSSAQSSFVLCGAVDPQLARALETMIAGRSFSVSLTGTANGCATLTVSAGGDVRQAGATQSTNLSITAGTGSSARRYDVQITSESGQTRVSLNSTNASA